MEIRSLTPGAEVGDGVEVKAKARLDAGAVVNAVAEVLEVEIADPNPLAPREAYP